MSLLIFIFYYLSVKDIGKCLILLIINIIIEIIFVYTIIENKKCSKFIHNLLLFYLDYYNDLNEYKKYVMTLDLDKELKSLINSLNSKLKIKNILNNQVKKIVGTNYILINVLFSFYLFFLVYLIKDFFILISNNFILIIIINIMFLILDIYDFYNEYLYKYKKLYNKRDFLRKYIFLSNIEGRNKAYNDSFSKCNKRVKKEINKIEQAQIKSDIKFLGKYYLKSRINRKIIDVVLFKKEVYFQFKIENYIPFYMIGGYLVYIFICYITKM